MKKLFFQAILWLLFLNTFFISGCGGGSGDKISTPAILTSISITPTSPGIVQGATQQFTATGTYSDNSTNDVTLKAVWTSSNTSNATVSNVGLATGAGVGTSTIEASLGGKTNSTQLTVTTTAVAPAISTQPADKSVTEGQTATFSVVASGTAPLTYQWKKNGTNVGTNTSSYTTPVTVLADNGAKFSVVVSNATGSVTSADATLTVTTLPAGVVRILFLHHSTGMYVFDQGVPQFFTDYNSSHSTQYQLTELWYPSNNYSPRFGNYPYDYWNLWVNHQGASHDGVELNLDDIAPNYDVIVFKHCFPVSEIYPDSTPDVSSVGQTIANYQLQYAALKTRMKEFPGTKFILWTGAALNIGSNTPDSAQRAQTFFNWVKNTWDESGDNIFIWDFYALETAGSEPYMNDAYDSGTYDSHPNPTFSATVAPYFAQRVVDVIEGRGDTGSITGQ